MPVDARAQTAVTELMAPVVAIPESRDLDELLVDLREGGQQLAVVVDEHGGTAGMITLEDVLEEIVGEIDDEYDAPPTMLTRVEAVGSTVVPGSLHPDEVMDATGFEMPEGEYETLAGLVLDRLGHIPVPRRDGRRSTAGASKWSPWIASGSRRFDWWRRSDRVVPSRGPRPADRQRVLRRGRVRPARQPRDPARAHGRGRVSDKRAALALESIRDLQPQLAGAQLGITMASLGLGFVAEPALEHVLDDAIGGAFDLPSGVTHTLAFLLSFTIVVVIHMVDRRDGAEEHRDRRLPSVRLGCWRRPTNAYVTLFKPVVWFLTVISNAITRMLGMEPADELNTALTVNEFHRVIEGAVEEGKLDSEEHDLLAGALDFRARTAGSIMVPRRRMVTVPRSTSVADIEALVASGRPQPHPRHRRQPRRRRSASSTAKDLLRFGAGERNDPVPLEMVRRMLIVTPDQSVRDLMRSMRRLRRHMALVRTSEGQLLGMVTLGRRARSPRRRHHRRDRRRRVASRPCRRADCLVSSRRGLVSARAGCLASRRD